MLEAGHGVRYPMTPDLLAYIKQRQKTRRVMAMVAFVKFSVEGLAIVATGLLIPGWAERIDHMATFLSLYFTSLAAIIAWYWGVEHMGMVGVSEGTTYMASSSFQSTQTTVAAQTPDGPVMVGADGKPLAG